MSSPVPSLRSSLNLQSCCSTCTHCRCVEINLSGEEPFNKSKTRLLRALAKQQRRLQHRQHQHASSAVGGALSGSITYTVAAAGSNPGEFLAGVDTVIVDPPRKGLEPALLDALCDSSAPRTLIYLSCGWPALKQEFDRLAVVYELVHAQAFLFFPGTDAIETLCVFRRRPCA